MKRKTLTKRQVEIVEQMSKNLNRNYLEDAEYIKNKIVSIEVGGRPNVDNYEKIAVENYGLTYNLFKTEPNGVSRIALILN